MRTTSNPLVSIVTVCLNSEKHIEQAMKSVLNQTYENIEYLIIDGGSKDKTLKIIKKYENHLKYWVSEPDKGLYDALNKGILHASGNIIGILHSDDWYPERAVELVVKEYLKDKKAGVFLGDIMLVTKNGNFIRVNGTPELIGSYRWKNINHPTCFIKREIYQKYKYDLNFKVCSDFNLFLKLYFNGVKFHYLNEILVYWRSGGISSSYTTLLENYRIRKKYFGNRVFILLEFLGGLAKRFLVKTVFRGDLNNRLLKWLRKRKRAKKERLPQPSASQ